MFGAVVVNGTEYPVKQFNGLMGVSTTELAAAVAGKKIAIVGFTLATVALGATAGIVFKSATTALHDQLFVSRAGGGMDWFGDFIFAQTATGEALNITVTSAELDGTVFYVELNP